MIVVFDLNGYWSDLVYILDNVNFKMVVIQKITDSVKKHLDKTNIIIPLGIKSQIEIGKYPNYKKKCLINDEYIYNILDDKIIFYDFIEDEKILNNSPIKLIKTYNDCKYDNIKKKFLLKHRNECAAKGNMIKNDYVNNLIKEYNNTHQIQDYIDIKKVYSISFLCKNGKLIKSLNFIKKGSIQSTHINIKIPLTIKKTKKIFTDVIEKIIEKINLNGIHEIEFIKDTNNNIYLMEWNPRIAGTLKCLYNDESPFIDELIISYCNIIANEQIIQPTFNKLNSIYHGNLYKKYNVCNCGLVNLK